MPAADMDFPKHNQAGFQLGIRKTYVGTYEVPDVGIYKPWAQYSVIIFQSVVCPSNKCSGLHTKAVFFRLRNVSVHIRPKQT